jgi:hypothetical protein
MTSRTQTFEYIPVAGVVLAALAMSVGWGFRGDYGHEASFHPGHSGFGSQGNILCPHDEPLPGSHLRFAQTE